MDTYTSEEMARVVAGAARILQYGGWALRRDERQDELDDVLKAANYRKFVSIDSNHATTCNAGASYDEKHQLHHVRINGKLNRQLTRIEATAIIAHEVSHLKRRDTIWHRRAVKATRRLVIRLARLAAHRWSPVSSAAVRKRLRSWPQRVSVWLSMMQEYRADADVVMWLGPDYALPLAGALYKCKRFKGYPAHAGNLAFRWRTHPPMVRRYRALGVTTSQVVDYIRHQRFSRRTEI